VPLLELNGVIWNSILGVKDKVEDLGLYNIILVKSKKVKPSCNVAVSSKDDWLRTSCFGYAEGDYLYIYIYSLWNCNWVLARWQ
jgi:hypothetical protein